tara:strand:+ start:3397 stop:3531 length:135 start_codon:yes stop_codon:yes gene_type:complete
MMSQQVKKGNKPQKPENRKPIPFPIWRYDFIKKVGHILGIFKFF